MVAFLVGEHGFWAQGLQKLQRSGLGVVGCRLLRVRVQYLRFMGSRAWAQLLHSMWNSPRPGVKSVSPALSGGFLSTVLPGKSPEVTTLEVSE